MERIEEYFVANDINEAKKRSTLLCNIGSKAYGIVRSLLSPDKPASASYRLIVEKLTDHFHPKPSVTVARFGFSHVVDYLGSLCSRRLLVSEVGGRLQDLHLFGGDDS